MDSYFVTYRHINGKIIGPEIKNDAELKEVRNSPFVREILAVTVIYEADKEKSKENHKDQVAWALEHMKVERTLTLKLTGKLQDINKFRREIRELSNRYDLNLDHR